MIDGGDEVSCVPETEGAMADQLDLVVHALHGSVGEAHAASRPGLPPDATAAGARTPGMAPGGSAWRRASTFPNGPWLGPAAGRARTVGRTLSGSRPVRWASSSG